MKILAIDASVVPGSIATWNDGAAVFEIALDPDRRTTATFALAMRDVVAQSGWSFSQLDAIAVSIGPGSFTGLRIAVTAAKSLAYALNCHVRAVSSLQVIASQTADYLQESGLPARSLHAVMDAQRGDFFAAGFKLESGELCEIAQARIVSREAWIQQLQPGAAIGGPGLARSKLDIPEGVLVAVDSCWSPRAATLAELAATDLHKGRHDDLWQLKPHYLRPSAAEEKRLSNHAK